MLAFAWRSSPGGGADWCRARRRSPRFSILHFRFSPSSPLIGFAGAPTCLSAARGPFGPCSLSRGGAPPEGERIRAGRGRASPSNLESRISNLPPDPIFHSPFSIFPSPSPPADIPSWFRSATAPSGCSTSRDRFDPHGPAAACTTPPRPHHEDALRPGHAGPRRVHPPRLDSPPNPRRFRSGFSSFLSPAA